MKTKIEYYFYINKSLYMKKIEKQKVINCGLWKPPEKYISYNEKSNSWFDIIKTPFLNNKVEYSTEIKTLRCKSYRIYPTLKQQNILMTWMKLYRIVYNKTVLYLRKEKKESFFTLRKIITKQIKENRYLQ